MPLPRDSIVAIATAPGAGGVGVVRVSGPQALHIARALSGKELQPKQARVALIRDQHGAVLDQALLLGFRAPASFTGEDVLEVQAHGSPVMLNLIVQRCIALGARAARPGEFSERAFLNNKLDLTQAEAIADLIAAGTEASARAAVRSLQGEFASLVKQILHRLIALRTHIEALIDFSDEDIQPKHVNYLAASQAELHQELTQLLARARAGQRLRDGLYVVILGAPNAGKSSLLNAMAQHERAIVTAIPGTTRDVLREQIELDGLAVTLVDTAGLRQSSDPIETEGIRRAKAEISRADLILLLVAANTAQADSFAQLQAEIEQSVSTGHALLAAPLRVLNKVDLLNATELDTLPESDLRICLQPGSEAGLEPLKAALLLAAGLQTGLDSGGSFSARARHVHCLESVQQHLQDSLQYAGLQHLELAAEELRLAQRGLAEITGVFSADDLLGQIFSSFCIGK